MSNALKFVVTISLNIAAITCVMSNNELTNNDTNSREQMCIVPDSSIEVNEKQGRCFCACALEFNDEVNKILLKCMYILYIYYYTIMHKINLVQMKYQLEILYLQSACTI